MRREVLFVCKCGRENKEQQKQPPQVCQEVVWAHGEGQVKNKTAKPA